MKMSLLRNKFVALAMIGKGCAMSVRDEDDQNRAVQMVKDMSDDEFQHFLSVCNEEEQDVANRIRENGN